MKYVKCGRAMRPGAVRAADAPGTVPAVGNQCSMCYQRARSVRPPMVKSAFVTTATPADMATVARMVSARFPDEPELLSMLGLAA